MKKRIVCFILAATMSLGSFGMTAGATTRKSVLESLDKWVYNTSIIKGTYNSSYYNPWSTHWTSVQNNKSGAYSKQSAAALGTCKASVTANWFGPDGTARIGLGR